jgi:hypothetical protein
MIDREDIIRMAKEARMPYFYGTWEIVNVDGLERFAALVAAHEREQCAKICDALAVDPEYASQTSKLAAMAIRDRGEK